MTYLSLIGLLAGFGLAVYGNALGRPEMDRFFRKEVPQNRQEEKDLRQKNAKKGLLFLALGILIFIASLYAFVVSFLALQGR